MSKRVRVAMPPDAMRAVEIVRSERTVDVLGEAIVLYAAIWRRRRIECC